MYKTRLLKPTYGDLLLPYFYNQQTVFSDKQNPIGLYVKWKRDYPLKYSEGRSKASTLRSSLNVDGYEQLESTTLAPPHFNNCSHVKVRAFNYPYLIAINHPTNPNYVYCNDYYRDIPGGAAISNLGSLVVTPRVAYESAQRRAWWSMQPRFESEFSMLNFIYELKDFKGLLKLANTSLYGWKTKVWSIRSKMRNIAKTASAAKSARNILSGSTKVLADVWLAKQFAVDPLISDVGNILQYLKGSVDAAQEEFSSRGLEEQHTHYTETLSDVRTGKWSTGQYAYVFTGLYSKAVFSATMAYHYDYALRSGWDAFNRFWGLELTTGVIWEAIPFSFLVDYFCKVGNAIHSMAKDPNVNLKVDSYCESVITSKSYGVHYNADSPIVDVLYMPSERSLYWIKAEKGLKPIVGVSWTNFGRSVCSPNQGAALPRMACASNRQTMNMLALVRGFLK